MKKQYNLSLAVKEFANVEQISVPSIAPDLARRGPNRQNRNQVIFLLLRAPSLKHSQTPTFHFKGISPQVNLYQFCCSQFCLILQHLKLLQVLLLVMNWKIHRLLLVQPTIHFKSLLEPSLKLIDKCHQFPELFIVLLLPIALLLFLETTVQSFRLLLIFFVFQLLRLLQRAYSPHPPGLYKAFSGISISFGLQRTCSMICIQGRRLIGEECIVQGELRGGVVGREAGQGVLRWMRNEDPESADLRLFTVHAFRIKLLRANHFTQEPTESSLVAEGLEIIDIVEGLDFVLLTLLDQLDHFLLDPPLSLKLVQLFLEAHLRLVELHLAPDVVLQLQVADAGGLPQSQVFVLDLLLGFVLFPEALGQFVVDLDTDVAPELARFFGSCALLGGQLGFDELKGSVECTDSLYKTSVLSCQTSCKEIVYLQHAVLASFQRLNLMELMHFHQELLQDLLSVQVPVSLYLPTRLLLVQQFVASLALQLKEAVHQLVDRINLDDQELLVENLVVLWIDQPKTLCEIGGSLQEVVVAQVGYPRFSKGFKVVHENGGGLFCLFPVLFGKSFDPFFYLLDFWLVLDFWEVKGFDVAEEVFDIGVRGAEVMRIGEGGFFEIYNDALSGVSARCHLHPCLISNYFQNKNQTLGCKSYQRFNDVVKLFFLGRNCVLSYFYYSMQTGLFAIEAQVLNLKSTAVPQGPLIVTLRIGRANTSSTFQNTDNSGYLDLNLLLQLNVDSAGLENQRCTLTFSREDKSIVGIALMSLPKQAGEIKGNYKLNQSQDKKAEVSLRLTIRPFESSPPAKINPETSNDFLQPMIIKKQSKEPLPSSISKVKSTVTKTVEEDDQLAVLQSELARLKREKQVYYQLYQIEKSKSEFAGRFIAKLIQRITNEHPELQKSLQNDKVTLLGKSKNKEGGPNKQDSEALKQLEQANRSLHRQVEDYKKVNEQLKNQLCRNNPAVKGNSLMPPGGIDQLFPNTKSNIKARNSNILSSIKSEIQPPSTFAEVDLKKWLQESVGQREELQKWLQSLPKETQNSVPHANLPKLRLAVNKTYVGLLSKGAFSRESILAHKREINSILDEQLVN